MIIIIISVAIILLIAIHVYYVNKRNKLILNTIINTVNKIQSEISDLRQENKETESKISDNMLSRSLKNDMVFDKRKTDDNLKNKIFRS